MISAAFLASDVPLLELEPHGKYFVFVFGEPEKCTELEIEWMRGELNVSASKYASAIKKLKNLIYSRK